MLVKIQMCLHWGAVLVEMCKLGGKGFEWLSFVLEPYLPSRIPGFLNWLDLIPWFLFVLGPPRYGLAFLPTISAAETTGTWLKGLCVHCRFPTVFTRLMVLNDGINILKGETEVADTWMDIMPTRDLQGRLREGGLQLAKWVSVLSQSGAYTR